MATSRDLCKACDDLKYNAPHFVANGLTDKECQSLMNNTGLDPKANHDDCEDLHNMQDCLMEGLKEDIPTYDDCDWKTAFTDLLTNLNNMLQAIVCVICGLWDEIARIWNALNRLKCLVESVQKPRRIVVTEEYAIPGPGVSWHRIDMANYNPPTIEGNAYCIRALGSVHLDNSWLSGLPYNYNGEPHYISNAGRLLWRWKLNKAEWHIKNMWSVPAYTMNVGTETHAEFRVYWAGEQTLGYMSAEDTNGVETVPDGWFYVDMRLHHAEHLGDGDVTFGCVAPIVLEFGADC